MSSLCPACRRTDAGCQNLDFKIVCRAPEGERPATPAGFDYCGWSSAVEAHLFLSLSKPKPEAERVEHQRVEHRDLVAPPALPAIAEPPTWGGPTELAVPKRDRPVLVKLSDVTPQAIRWVWPGRIAAGKLTLISGDPGRGKSLLTHDLAARITTGRRWPVSTERAELGAVIFLQAEDGLADTLHPRIAAADGDPARVYCLTAVETIGRDGLMSEQPFTLTADVPALEEAIERVGDVRMIVVDPVSCFMGSTDANDNAQVRGVLAPLSALADRTGVAILCVQHLRKSDGRALHKSLGSIGYVAAARAAFVVCDDPDDEDDNPRRLLLASKMNIAPLPSGLAYTVEDNGAGLPIVIWSDEAVAMTADEAMTPRRKGPGRPATAIAEAVDLLRERVADGPVEQATIIKLAEEEGISGRTLRRAKAELGIESVKAGRTGWLWVPPTPGAEGGQNHT